MSESSRGLNKKSNDNNYLDSSCYGTYMRMAKPYAMRYPLEECQGNSGTIIATGDEAASRYTELKLSKSSHYLYDTLSKNTIDKWNPNFDDTEKFPTVFPSIGYYNIINGTTGIGVSIAANKVKGAYASLVSDVYSAQRARLSNDANILCMGAFTTGSKERELFTTEFLTKEFVKGCGSQPKVDRFVEYDLNRI